MGVRFAEPDAWIVTTVETELDRSNVPDAGTIHTYDASVIVDVAKVDLAMGKSSARLNDQPTEYTHGLLGADFNKFRTKLASVSSGNYIIGKIYQAVANSIALVCVNRDGSLLPGVRPIAIAKGETVFFGHVVLTMKLDPLPRGDVAYPAKLVGIRYEPRPAGIERRLAAAGIDTSTVRFVSGATAGCRMQALDLKLRLF